MGGIKCANAHILANLKVLDPLFESKSDFYIEKGIAEAMGLGDLFPADGEEYARALLTTDDPQMAGFTLEKLQEAGGALRLIGSEDLIAPEVGFTYGTASGRQEPYYEALLEFGQAFPAWEAPCEAYPENPLREKYPLQFNQGALSLPRALGLLWCEVDSGSGRALHRAESRGCCRPAAWKTAMR